MIFQNRGQFGGQVARRRSSATPSRQGTSKWPGFGKLYRWKVENLKNFVLGFVRLKCNIARAVVK